MSDLNEQLRAEFEAWAKKKKMSRVTGRLGGYMYSDTARAWEAWQAARRAPAASPAPVAAITDAELLSIAASRNVYYVFGMPSMDAVLAFGKEVIKRQSALAAAPPAQTEPVAWMSEDGRVLPMSAMETARRVGGATATAMKPYTIPLVRGDAAPTSSTAEAKDAALTELLTRIDDAHEAYERHGEICEFEGNSMIYASTLEEIVELRGKYHAAIASSADEVKS